MVVDIGKDCWDIIMDYKYGLEHKERFNKVITEIDNKCLFNSVEKIKFRFGGLIYRVCKFKLIKNNTKLIMVFENIFDKNGNMLASYKNLDLEHFSSIINIEQQKY